MRTELSVGGHPLGDPVEGRPAGSPPPPSFGEPPASNPRRRRWLILAVAAVVVLVGGTATGLYLSRDRGHRPKPLVLPSVSPQLDSGGLQLASLLTAGRQRTFHVHYTSTSDPKVSGGGITFEWWNTNTRSRIDTTVVAPDGTQARTASIANGEQSVACQQPAGAGWTCRKVPPPPQGDPAGLVASLTAQLSGRSVTEHADKVGGRPARCFHVTGGTEPIDACTSTDGVLLRIASAEAGFEATDLDSNVPSKAFDPPAKSAE